MFRKETPRQAPEFVTYPAVDDTDEAVAGKLRRMASDTARLDLAEGWTRIAVAAEAGQLSPSIRREFARGTQFAK